MTTLDKGHGRLERRSIQVLQAPGAAGFAHAEQVARLERKVERIESMIENRRRVRRVRTTHEVVYLITSIYPEQAGPEDILAIDRGHWTVETMHYIRDVSMGEDQSQARTGSGPQVLAVLRSAAVSLIRGWGFATVPEGHRHFIRHIDELFHRLGIGHGADALTRSVA